MLHVKSFSVKHIILKASFTILQGSINSNLLSVVIEAFKELVMFLYEYTICKLIVWYTATGLFA